MEQVKLGRIYCAYADGFENEGAEEDVKVLQANFPGHVLPRRRISKSQLETDLSSEKFDIVHLVLRTDRRSGDVFFGDLPSERMKADRLLQLIEDCGARMICLATCNSTVLGTHLSRVATTIAAEGENPTEAWVDWVRVFYTELARGNSVYGAYDRAKASSYEPMTLHRKGDTVFQVQ